MSAPATRRPAVVSATSAAVLDVLAQLTMFPWPLLKTQATRRGLDPAALSPDDVPLLIDDLVKGIEQFTSPEKGAIARERLASLGR